MAFPADATKTKGYVLLLSDITITGEIKIEDYQFADLYPVVDLTIAGYQEKRTISAGYQSRIMRIGYTNGNITLQNLKLTCGYTDDFPDTEYAGGAALYITSNSIADGKKCVIDYCTITDNSSKESAGAISIKSDYEVYLTHSEITLNNCYDGASACIVITDSGITNPMANLIISETTISQNNSHVTTGETGPFNYGYVINAAGIRYVSLAGGVVIKDNYIDSVPVSPASAYSELGAVNIYAGLEISGANIISENKVGLMDVSGTQLTKNIVLVPGASATTRPIYLKENCKGSSIGVALSEDISNSITFTNGYKASGTTVAPGSIFVSDCSYGIGYDSTGSEAAFLVSGGSFGSALDYSVNFATSPSVLPSGFASTIKVTPTVIYNGADVTSSVSDDIIWNLVLKCGSVTVAKSEENTNTNTLTVTAAQALPDTYTLYVTATLNGIAYDETVSLVCKNTLEGMVSVSGASVNGAVADSGVFVTGRNLTIPAMYAGESELTQKEYLEYCYYGHSSKTPASNFSGDNYPACLISWYDAIVYCNLRSIAEGLTPAYSLGGQTDPRLWDGIVAGTEANAGKYCGPLANTESWNNITFDTNANGWRMPVEAEWEYLARGGNLDSASQTTYAGSNNWEEVAWAGEGSTSTPHVVKQKAANSLGLYDMSGNVYEYVWDWYGGDISSSVGMTGYDSPILHPTYNNYRRMVRGGATTYSSEESKISDRSVSNTPEMRWSNCGVRIVRNQN